eukprot:379366_1
MAEGNPESKNNVSIFKENNNTNNVNKAVSPKRRKSKLKQRRLKAKLKTKQLKNEQTRYQKTLQKNEENNKISTNEMYPECKPLSKEEIDLITTTINCANINDLKLSNNLGKELDDGYIEYKWKLVCPKSDRIQHLVTQQRYRLNEGNGKCIYEIGIEDCGNPKGLSDYELIETIKTIFRLNKQLNGKIQISCVKNGLNGKVAALVVVNESVKSAD